MNNKAIGIFDSGIGGLTVAKEIHKELSKENIIYFGDTAHLPYGNKSEKSIIDFSIKNVEFLIEKGAKIIVVACNTSTSVAIKFLKKKFNNINIIGVIEPGAKAAIDSTLNNKIGVIGTFRTIKTSAYKNSIVALKKKLNVFEKACPLFVPIIEENFNNKKIIKEIIEEYLNPIVTKKIDTLVLGCTHYPLLKNYIKKIYKQLKIVDSAKETAKEIKQILIKNKLENITNKTGKISIFLNDRSESFDNISKKLFPGNTLKLVNYNV